METTKLLVLEDPITSLSKIIKLEPPSKHQSNNIQFRSIITKELAHQFRDIPYFYAILNGKLLTQSNIDWNQLERFNLVIYNFVVL